MNGNGNTRTLSELILREDAAQLASYGQSVFPAAQIEALALALSKSIGRHVPTTECEAAVVQFVSALIAAGWRVYRYSEEEDNSSLHPQPRAQFSDLVAEVIEREQSEDFVQPG